MDPSNIANAVANGDSSILLILIGMGSFAVTWYIYEQVKTYFKNLTKRN